jgi:hypothetical protein
MGDTQGTGSVAVDVGAFVVCTALGYWAGYYLPPGIWSISVSVFVSYHLFLVWLMIIAPHPVGFSLPVWHTILTHLACFTLVLVLILGRHVIPFFGIVRYFVPGMAPFERDWLFKGTKKKVEETPVAAVDPAVAAVHAAATGEDYDAWQRHLASRNPLSRKPGTTLKDEYEQFMVARVKARVAASASGDPA